MNRLKQITPKALDHPFIVAFIVTVVALFLLFALLGVKDWWSTRRVNKHDQKLEQKIQASENAAATSEANANNHGDDALKAEGRHERSLEQWQAAGENSNRSAEQVRKARQRNEENKDRTVTGPTFTDAELCAELAKRGIANPCHQQR